MRGTQRVESGEECQIGDPGDSFRTFGVIALALAVSFFVTLRKSEVWDDFGGEAFVGVENGDG